jgi:hypothetical protein
MALHFDVAEDDLKKVRERATAWEGDMSGNFQMPT